MTTSIKRATDQAERNFKHLTATVDAQVKKIKGAFGPSLFQPLLVAGASVSLAGLAQTVISTADAYTRLQGRLRLVSSSQRDLQAIQDKLFKSAQNIRVPVQDLASLYFRTAQATQRLGATQKEILGVTETVARAFQVSATTAEEASAATIQFGQALQSGRLQGDELKSISENAPRLFQAIISGIQQVAPNLKVTVENFRDLAATGVITTAKVFKGIQANREQIEKEFAQIPRTISQAFIQVQNEVFRAAGTADTSPVIGALDALRKNIADPAFQKSVVDAASGILKLLGAIGQGVNKILEMTQAVGGLSNAVGILVGGFAALKFSRLVGEIAQATQAFTVLQVAKARDNALTAAGDAVYAKMTKTQVAAAAARAADAAAVARGAVADEVAAKARYDLALANTVVAKAEFEASLQMAKLYGNMTVTTAAAERLARAEAIAAEAGVALAAAQGTAAKATAAAGAAQAGIAVAASRAGAAAQTAAKSATAVGLAARAGAIGIGVFRGALAFLGGPIGLGITALSLLVLWFNRTKDAAEDAAPVVKKSLEDLIKEREKAASGTFITDEEEQALEEAKKNIKDLGVEYARLNAIRAQAMALADLSNLTDTNRQIVIDTENEIARVQQRLAAAAAMVNKFESLASGQVGGIQDPTDGVSDAVEKARTIANAVAKAEQSIADARAEAEKQRLDFQFEQNFIGYKRYYARLQQLELEANDRQVRAQQALIAAAQKDLATAKPAGKPAIQADIIEAKAQLEALGEQRIGIVQKYGNMEFVYEKDLADNIIDLRIRLAQAVGDDAKARSLQIEKDFRDLLANMRKNATDADIEIAVHVKEAETLRAEYDAIITKLQREQDRVARQQQTLDLAVQTGSLSRNAAHQAEIGLIKETIRVQQPMLDQLDELAKKLGNPELIADVQRLRNELKLTGQVGMEAINMLSDSIENNLGDAIVDFFEGTKSMSRAFKDMIRSIIGDITRFIAQRWAQQFVDSLFGPVRANNNAAGGGGQPMNLLQQGINWLQGALTGTTTTPVAGPVQPGGQVPTITTGPTASTTSWLSGLLTSAGNWFKSIFSSAPTGQAGGGGFFDSLLSSVGSWVSKLFGGGAGAGAGAAAGGGWWQTALSFIGGLFADGGDPPVGKVSMVGERGPELFIPKERGTIISNEALRAAMSMQKLMARGNIRFDGFFADGGRPKVGYASVVGERGPEPFIPDTARAVSGSMNRNVGGGRPEVKVRIANAFDSRIVGDYLQTEEGEQLIKNYITRNGTLIRSVAAGG